MQVLSAHSILRNYIGTNLPHTQVTDKISELIKRCYDEKKLEYINVSDNYVARWLSKTRGK